MWVILTTICFWNTALMMNQDSPICWKDALLPLRYESESSCILVMQQLSRDLQTDMSNRLVTMQMTCHFAEDYPNYKHKEIDKLPLYKDR
jgi:hypothetical protein